MKSRTVSAESIRSTYTPEKQELDRRYHYWAYVVIRPVSFYAAVPFVKMGLNATKVTIVGAVVLVVGLGLIAISKGNVVLAGFGAAMVNLWYLFDFVDGNVARFNSEESSVGAFLDWLVGHGYHVLLPTSVGIAITLGATAGSIAGGAIYAGFVVSVLEASRSVIAERARRFDNGIGRAAEADEQKNGLRPDLKFLAHVVISFKSPVLFVSVLAGLLEVWLVVFGVVSLMGFLAAVMTGLKSAYRLDRNLSVNS